MKLKTRIAQILSIGLAANVLLGLLVQKWVVLPSFEHLERQEAQRVAHRCTRAIEQEVQHLNLVCGDWSNWTEMYTFVADRRQDFLDSSLAIDSLLNLGLDFFYIADSEGRCIRGMSLTPDREAITSRDQFEQLFGPASDLMTAPGRTEKIVTGVVNTRRGPMMISARSILTSGHAGPSRGTVIMGRLLNEARVRNLGLQTCTNLRYWQLGTSNAIDRVGDPEPLPDLSATYRDPADKNYIVQELRRGRSPHVQAAHRQLKVSNLIPGIGGEPALLIEATIPRDIFERGRISSAWAVISIVVASVLFLALTRFFMHTAVSRPLMRLVDRVVAIASNPQISDLDVRIRRDDEIGLLSSQFHDCFTGLQYRDRLLSAVAEAAGSLLREPQLDAALTSVTASLGQAMHADGVAICRLDNAAEGPPRAVQHTSWWRTPPPQSGPAAQSPLWPAGALDLPLIEDLRRGKSIEGKVSSLPPQLRPGLEAQGIHSILLVPIAVHESLWGFIAFTSTAARSWSDTEEALLSAIADSMGSAILRQVTEDALLEARQAANDASRAKSDFLARMSHEIRTPMNGVLGMLDLLEKTTLDDRQHRYAQIARTSATALLGIINDILDFSKIEAGKMELAPAEIDLQEVVQDAVGLLANRAAEKRLELICDVKQDVPHLVRADALRLRQVLVNLVGNAVKFTDKGTVSTEVRVVGTPGQVVNLRVAVKDTGCGIREDLQSKLFQVFSQVDSFGVRRFNGSGLGLVICKRLVEMMGGEMGVRSRPGGGSEFWFTANFEVVSTAPAGRPRTTLPWKAAMIRVLAVDDNATNLEILHGYLSSWGFHAETAGGATEALEKLRAAAAMGTTFDLAILDQDMPGMTGIELARTIKTSGPFQHTVLILLSSISELPSKQELLDCGFVAGLTKPVRQSDLLDAIVAALPGTAVRAEPGPVGRVLNPCVTCASAGEPRALGTHSTSRDPLPSSERHVQNQSEGDSHRPNARILVAEDNEINREVIHEMLTQNGYQVHIVENGRQAVEAAQEAAYDVLLMDCQMPVLDGFAASRTIREMEKTGRIKTGGRDHLPIVALTANALSGDREQCLAAGMDEYLSKPIESKQLKDVLDRILSETPASQEQTTEDRGRRTEDGGQRAEAPAPETPTPDVHVFDRACALKRCMNDEAFLQRILDKFSHKLPKDIEELEQTVGQVNPQKVAFLAHALKGAAANLSAERLREAACQLEQAGKSGDFGRIRELLDAVKDEARRFLEMSPCAS